LHSLIEFHLQNKGLSVTAVTIQGKDSFKFWYLFENDYSMCHAIKLSPSVHEKGQLTPLVPGTSCSWFLLSQCSNQATNCRNECEF
jgi:hypothetical protein